MSKKAYYNFLKIVSTISICFMLYVTIIKSNPLLTLFFIFIMSIIVCTAYMICRTEWIAKQQKMFLTFSRYYIMDMMDYYYHKSFNWQKFTDEKLYKRIHDVIYGWNEMEIKLFTWNMNKLIHDKEMYTLITRQN